MIYVTLPKSIYTLKLPNYKKIITVINCNSLYLNPTNYIQHGCTVQNIKGNRSALHRSNVAVHKI